MKNNFNKYFLILVLIFSTKNLSAKELYINAANVELSKENKIVYAEGNVEIYDKMENTIYSEKAKYDKIKGIVETIGPTKVITSEKYIIEGEDIFYDDNKKIIYSQNQTTITDTSKNKIDVNMFNYLTKKNDVFFKSRNWDHR